MAWVQNRNGSWRVLFRYQGKQHTFWMGEVGEEEAKTVCAKVDYWLMRLKQKLVQLPPGRGVVTFVQHDGHPPGQGVAALGAANLSLQGLRDAYLRSQEKKLEETTLDGTKLHFGHLTRILGGDRVVTAITRPDLQAYVSARAAEWIDPNVYRRKRRERDAAKKPRKNRKPPPPESEDKPLRHPSAATIKKEIVSFRTAWNWARRHVGLREEFPGGGLDYSKIEENLPFMTWDEAERRVAAGDDPEKVWDSVYLRPGEITELLAWVNGRPLSPWVYVMFCFAAHTGARRSEIVRSLPSDVDLVEGVVTIREKKRDKRKTTTRRVPLTPFLKDILTEWMRQRANGRNFFCKQDGSAITPREAHNYFKRAVRVPKWNVLKGWHVFRHSFISALASRGVDQRIIDDIVGHQTEEQRRRYRHLYPDVKAEALRSVFGERQRAKPPDKRKRPVEKREL